MRKIPAVIVMFLAACAPVQPAYLEGVEGDLVAAVGQSNFGGKIFCAYDLLGSRGREEEMEVFVWALCREYFLAGQELTSGTASSLPVALHLKKSGDGYALTGFDIPQDGTGFMPSIQAAFPAAAIRRMCLTDAECYNGRANRLEQEIRQRARSFFGPG